MGRPTSDPRSRGRPPHCRAAAPRMATHRTRRRDAAIVAVIAAVAGLVATVANAEPTGRPVTDYVLVGLGVAVITALGSRAPWWMLALIAASSAIALEAPLLALAAIAFATSRPRPVAADRPWAAVRALGGDHLQRPDQGRRRTDSSVSRPSSGRSAPPPSSSRPCRVARSRCGAWRGLARCAPRWSSPAPRPGSDTPCTHRATR